jgi:hypothetical protein
MYGNLGITSGRFSMRFLLVCYSGEIWDIRGLSVVVLLSEALDRERKISRGVLGVARAGEFIDEETSKYRQESTRTAPFYVGVSLDPGTPSLCHPDKVGLLD